MARESAEGQALELGWRRDNAVDVAEADYLEMVLKKTCWLTTIYPSRVGRADRRRGGASTSTASSASASSSAPPSRSRTTCSTSIGDAARYGKELGGDICEGKRTLMLITCAERTAAERASVDRLLALPRAQRTDADVRWVRARMDAYGCIDYARQVAHGLAGAARHEFRQLYGSLPDCETSGPSSRRYRRGSSNGTRNMRTVQRPDLPYFSSGI